MKFVIVKKTRVYRSGTGYTGSSCDSAFVAPGRIYDNYHSADEARKKLDNVNPVGFEVVVFVHGDNMREESG